MRFFICYFWTFKNRFWLDPGYLKIDFFALFLGGSGFLTSVSTKPNVQNGPELRCKPTHMLLVAGAEQLPHTFPQASGAMRNYLQKYIFVLCVCGVRRTTSPAQNKSRFENSLFRKSDLKTPKNRCFRAKSGGGLAGMRNLARNTIFEILKIKRGLQKT